MRSKALNLPGAGWSCLLLLAVIALPHRASAQQVTGMEASSFRVQLETYPPPHQTQLKTSLEGSKAEPQPGGKVILSQPKLNSFSTNGLLEMQARSSSCVFDTLLRSVSSTNILQVEMASGRFYTEGRGFMMTSNSVIILSNQVHTVIRPGPRKASKP
jgi:hypothetical protein